MRPLIETYKKKRAPLLKVACIPFCLTKQDIISLIPRNIENTYPRLRHCHTSGLRKKIQFDATFHKCQLKEYVLLCKGFGIYLIHNISHGSVDILC